MSDKEKTDDPALPVSDVSENDPRDGGAPDAETHDPHSGVSDDPRVDPTPDRRHTT